MSRFKFRFTNLWNNLPQEERSRMMPYMIESQRLHIMQCREKAVKAHERHLRELDDLMANLDSTLRKYTPADAQEPKQ